MLKERDPPTSVRSKPSLSFPSCFLRSFWFHDAHSGFREISRGGGREHSLTNGHTSSRRGKEKTFFHTILAVGLADLHLTLKYVQGFHGEQ